MPTQVYPYLPNSISVEKFDPNELNTVNGIANTATNKVEKVSADNVITNNARQFISLEEKNLLASMLDTITGTAHHVMYKEMYDRDDDGLVDVSKKSLTTDTVLWDNVIGRPDIPTKTIEKTAEDSHVHDNKEFLDALGIDKNGNITFNGKGYELPNNLMITNVYDVDGDGIIDKALYADSTNWENILNKPLFYMPSPHSHKVTDIDGNINAATINGLTSDDLVKKTDKISVEQIDNLGSIKVVVKEIHGGNATSEFDDETNAEETLIIERYDNATALKNISPVLSNMEKCYESNTRRYKIGNGIIGWNGLPYEYNTPQSIRFNSNAIKFISDYYDYNTNKMALVESIDTNILNPGNLALYSDAVRGYGNQIFGIPFNAQDVLVCDYDGSNLTTFASAINAINSKGAGWYSGVRFNDYIYCSPYNSNVVLKIDSHNRTIETIESPLMLDTGKKAKYTRGVLAANGRIYFAPHNIDAIMEIDPLDNTVAYFQSPSMFDTDENCCAVIKNPINNLLYFIPKKTNRILELDPFLKQISEVATINDYGINKFSTAVLAPNGLIYCIPGYGYDQLMIFDPNTYDIQYIPFKTDLNDSFNNAIVAPNNCLYLIPNGASNKAVVEYFIHNNSYISIYNASNNNKWCGGVLNINGHIICLPYTNTSLLDINTQVRTKLPLDVLLKNFG